MTQYVSWLLKKHAYFLKRVGAWFIVSLISFSIFLFLLNDVFNLFDWTLYHPAFILWIYFAFDLIGAIVVLVPLWLWWSFTDSYKNYKKELDKKTGKSDSDKKTKKEE